MSQFFTSSGKIIGFSFSISPSKEYSGLISFKIDCLISLQSKGLKSLLQYHNSEASILWCLSFYIKAQLSHAEYIMRNAGLKEAQAGIKIAGRNINNLRYADDTTLMAESEEELKSLLTKVKGKREKLA